jgi:hypothetical protein
MLRSFSGASVKRVIDRSQAQVPEHAHDWPVLSLFVIGSYLNETELGERFISSPSAVYYQLDSGSNARPAFYGKPTSHMLRSRLRQGSATRVT